MGGFIFLGIIFSPILKSVTISVKQQTIFMVSLGRRFNRIALPALVILIATGVYNSWALLSQPDLLTQSNYGVVLQIKMLSVIMVIIVYSMFVKILNGIQTSTLKEDSDKEYIQILHSKMMNISRTIVGLLITILLLSALLDSSALM